MKLIWSIAVAMATFVLLAYCGIRVIFDSNSWITAVAVGIIMVFSFPLSAILHELGHTLFSAMVKIKAVPDNNFLKETFLNWLGASSCKIIPKTENSLRARIIFTATGGTAVNLIFIVLGIVALCVHAVPTGLCALLPASFHLLALNALPLNLDNGKSDGEIILELLKNKDEAKVMLAVLKIQAYVLSGKPISEIDEKLLFEVPQIREDDLSFISLCELRYEYFTAKGDTSNAEKWRTRLEDLKQQYLN
ncbi:MAG: hypothetical protein K2N23_08105 [Clostridia bacterium]|nr:hypothetical protein [Clostridia bacterium]